MIGQLEQLQELSKSYYAFKDVNNGIAQEYLELINDIRFELALNAELRKVWYEQLDIEFNANAVTQSLALTRGDIKTVVVRGVADLENLVTLSFDNQGERNKVITRENTQWQHLFSDYQRVAPLGQQLPFDFPEPVFLGEQNALAITLNNQVTQDGKIIFHGFDLKDAVDEITQENLREKIANAPLPNTQLIPMSFIFDSNVAGTVADDGQGNNKIYSIQNSNSVLITHVSTTATDTRLTLIDEGRNQLICEEVEMLGIAGNYQNAFTVWYELPTPHLLRNNDRLRAKILNGSDITGNTQDANIENYLTFKGISLF